MATKAVTAPEDPFAGMFVDEIPAVTRTGFGHTDTEQDLHVKALIATGRVGLRVLGADDLEKQRRAYHAAGKRHDVGVWLVPTGDYIVVSLRARTTRTRKPKA